MPIYRFATVPAVATTLALALAAVPVPAPAAEPPAFELTIQDHKFAPAALVVPADRKIRLIVRNLDDTKEEFESYDLHREQVIAPGASAEIFVGPLAPGTYHYFGEFHQRTARGMLIAK